MIDPRKIQPVTEGPLSRLFLAINHYVATGDHFGEGVAHDLDGEHVRILIPININSEQDLQDWLSFRSRFDEVAPAYQLRIEYLGEHLGFEGWAFVIRQDQMEDVAAALRERPGPLGWGSGKAVIDAHTWEEGAGI